MAAFLKQLGIQFRGDLRDKDILMVYYLVPLVFYLVMGGVMNLPGLDAGKTMILSLTIFAVSMSAFLGLPQTLVKARENGVLDAYRVAGIPVWSVPLAGIIISFLHIMIVALIILATAPLLFQAHRPLNPGAHLLAVVLITLCSEALGVLLGALVKKQSTLPLAGQLLFMPTVMLSGIMFPATLLPKALQIGAKLLPATQGMALLAQGKIEPTPLFVLLGITIIAFSTAVFFFRKTSAHA